MMRLLGMMFWGKQKIPKEQGYHTAQNMMLWKNQGA